MLCNVSVANGGGQLQIEWVLTNAVPGSNPTSLGPGRSAALPPSLIGKEKLHTTCSSVKIMLQIFTNEFAKVHIQG
jgi:hypothetical protein